MTALKQEPVFQQRIHETEHQYNLKKVLQQRRSTLDVP